MTEIQSDNEKPADPTPPPPPTTDGGWRPWGNSEKQKFGEADGSGNSLQL